MWCALMKPSITKLITNWNNINFLNTRLEPDDWEKQREKQSFKLIVDDSVIIHYSHYIKDMKYDVPYIDDVDVKYKQIENYIKEKYDERLSRMNEPPTFVILDEMPYYDYTHDNMKSILELENDNKIICITKHKDLLDYNDNKHLCIFDDTNRLDENHCPIFYTKYANKINAFIKN
jgi:hypothetical protein